jgi:hypothetical protein
MGDGGLKAAAVVRRGPSFGETFLGPADVGDIQPVDITLGGQARYEDNNYILEALAMGSPAAVTISTSAVGQVTSWQHIFDLAPSIDGWARPSRWTGSSTSTRSPRRRSTASARDRRRRHGRADVQGARRQADEHLEHNINSTVYGASYPALNGKIFRKQGTFRSTRRAAARSGSTDAIKVENLRVRLRAAAGRTFGTGQDYIVEPGDNEFPMPSVKVTFPRMNTVSANSLYAALRGGTAFKGDWVTLGAFINSTDQWTRKYQFPYMELQDFQTPIGRRGAGQAVATFVLKKPSAAPTGMSGVTMPFRLTRIMQNSVVAF